MIRILFGLVFMLSEYRSFANDSFSGRSRNYGWIDLGIGGVSSSNFDGFGGTISFSHLSSIGLITLRYVGGEEHPLYADSYSALNPPYLGEIGVLYGRALKSDFFIASASTGISLNWGNRDLPRPDDQFRTIGLPFEAQAFVNVLPVMGVGVKIAMDLNTVSSFYSVLVCLRLGILRYVKTPADNDTQVH